MRIKVPSYSYKDGIINWGEPEVFHKVNKKCKIDDWHSIMACHLVKRVDNYPTIFWYIDTKHGD